MEKISIVVPIYNAMPYLPKCIESVLNQSFQDFRLILVDDGSTDESGKVCEAYGRKDERILVVHQINKGVGAARNKGIELSQGKYLMFLDPDDWIAPNLLLEVYQLAEQGSYDWVIWSLTAILFNEKQQVIGQKKIQAIDTYQHSKKACENIFLQVAKWDDLILGAPWNKLYRMEIVKNHALKFSNLRRRQDIVFNLMYFRFVTSMMTTSKTYSYYRVIDKGYAHKADKDYLEIALYVHHIFKETLRGFKKYEGDYKAFVNYSFLTDVIRTIGYCLDARWQYTWHEKYEHIRKIILKPEVQQAARLSMSYKPKGMRGNLNRLKIRWIKRGNVSCLLVAEYIEKLYQRIRYLKRIKRTMGGEI